MKRINIISETIYKGKHKLVNQGAFINMSDLMGDIFSCFGITCCNGLLASKSDFFLRKSALIYSRKKPGPNWQSLNKMVLDVYNCFVGTILCPGSRSAQWWITTDVIRPAKTVETINFTPIIEKVLDCCGIINTCIPINFRAYQEDWVIAGISNEADFLALLVAMGNANPVVSNFSLSSSIPSAITMNNFIAASISGAEILDFTFLTGSSELNLITTLPVETSYIDVSGESFSTDSLDILGGLFLQGTLPKSYWNSSNQLSSDQPSAGVQADLTANVNTVIFSSIFTNFDITANWASVGAGVTNQTTFENWLTSMGATSIVVNYFNLTGNRLKADIIVNGVGILNLTNKNVTLVEKIGGFNSSLTQIRLDSNQIVTFNPSIPLPASVTQLRLQNNQIVTFSPSIALPSSLTQLRLDNNQIVTFNPLTALPSGLLTILLNNNNITTFNPSIALPSSLQTLNLNNNNITTFNPTIALPSSLQSLLLNDNNIVTFNPSIALPNSVKYLYLINNQIITFNPSIALPTNLLELRLDNNNIVTFNPSIILPTGLINLNLSSNQMTTAGYTSSEPWANAQPAFSPNCTTFFPGNSNLITGTNLETILLTKNCTIIS